MPHLAHRPARRTTNFLHAIPIFAISIALEREGQIIAGVVYNPADDAIYVAERGQGAGAATAACASPARASCRRP